MLPVFCANRENAEKISVAEPWLRGRKSGTLDLALYSIWLAEHATGLTDVHNPKDDGNCGFSAISVSLVGNDTLSHVLRRAVHRFIVLTSLTTTHKIQSPIGGGFDLNLRSPHYPQCYDPNGRIDCDGT